VNSRKIGLLKMKEIEEKIKVKGGEKDSRRRRGLNVQPPSETSQNTPLRAISDNLNCPKGLAIGEILSRF